MIPLISSINDIISFLQTETKVINEKNDCKIYNFKSLNNAKNGDLTFCVYADEKGVNYINKSEASVIIAPLGMPIEKINSKSTLILVKNPRLCFIKSIQKFSPKQIHSEIHPTAIVETKKIGKNVSIGPHCFIDQDVEIGDNCVIHGGVQIFGSTKIGHDSKIRPSVVIGDAYFGPQRDLTMILETCENLGSVIIGNNVEIGSNSSVCPGMLDNTIIGDGTKISSQVYIGSGMKIGKNCNLTGQTYFGGMSTLEDNVYVAPGSVIRNKIKISKNAFVGMGTIVTKDVPEGTTVIGVPAKTINFNSDNNAISNIN
jgi:UDP-3-O-[3-hydroxymyristoyl] glucosamine N-acyltransferase